MWQWRTWTNVKVVVFGLHHRGCRWKMTVMQTVFSSSRCRSQFPRVSHTSVTASTSAHFAPFGCLCVATTAYDICACIYVQSCSQGKFLRGVPVTPDTPLAPILHKGWAHYGSIPQNPGFLSWAGKYRFCSSDHVLMCHDGSYQVISRTRISLVSSKQTPAALNHP